MASRNPVSVDLRILKDPEIRAVQPPPRGEEFPRRMALEEEYELEDNSDNLEALLKIRNDDVENQVMKSRGCHAEVPIPPKTGGDGEQKTEEKKPSSRVSTDDDFNLRRLSGGAMVTINYRRHREELVQNVIGAEVKRNDEVIELTKGKPFSYTVFERCRLVKWKIFVMKRLEKILRGEVTSLDGELEKFEIESMRELEHFVGLIGPVNTSDEGNKALLRKFKSARLEMKQEMLAFESKAKERMENNQELKLTKASELQASWKSLETAMKPLFEANLDLNPFTSKIPLCYFTMARPNCFQNTNYELHPVEMARFLEFDQEDIVKVEGFNPLLGDTLENPKCIYIEGEIRPNFEEESLKREDRMTGEAKKPGQSKKHKLWNTHLLELKSVANSFRFGVSPKVFLNKLESVYNEGTRRAGKAFGDLVEEGLLLCTDIFYTQHLGEGKNKRPILFPAALEGTIISPDELLKRYFKQILFLLEENHSIRLKDLPALYETCFNEPLYPLLDWGFKDAEDLIKYARKILPEEETSDITTVKSQLTNEKTLIRLVPNSPDVSNPQDDCSFQILDMNQLWLPVADGELPDDFIFEIVDESVADSLFN